MNQPMECQTNKTFVFNKLIVVEAGEGMVIDGKGIRLGERLGMTSIAKAMKQVRALISILRNIMLTVHSLHCPPRIPKCDRGVCDSEDLSRILERLRNTHQHRSTPKPFIGRQFLKLASKSNSARHLHLLIRFRYRG